MRKLQALLLTIVLLACVCVTAGAAGVTVHIRDAATGSYTEKTVPKVNLVCDGKTLTSDVSAFLLDSRTLVPVRVVSEQLGAQVEWDQAKQQVLIAKDASRIVLTIGSETAMVDGKASTLYGGVPATLVTVDKTARTMVPLRFVSDQLGAAVAWDNDTRTATVTTNQPTYDVAPPTVENGGIHVRSAAEPRVFSLPGRVVADFPGGVLTGSSFGKIQVDGAAVLAVRYNQYDTGYEGYARVARVVLDLQEGYERNDLEITYLEGVLTIGQPQAPPQPETPAEPLPETPEDNLPPLIVLDAGHGGTDHGAIYHDINEKDVNLPVTLAVGSILEQAGYRVHYSRTDDTYVTLSDRAEQANALGADIFVSVHANAFPQKPEISGLETYYLVGGTSAKALASAIQKRVLETTGCNDRQIRTANFYVLKHTEMPAVLVETGYLTNEAEAAMLGTDSYQQLIAQGIAQGITDYLGPVVS